MKKKLKKIIIAGVHNQFKPRLLRGLSLVAVISFMCVLAYVSNEYAKTVGRSELGASVYPALLSKYANKDRAAADVPQLTVNPVLERAARLKAEDMAAKGYFSHTSPEGVSPWHWFSEAGYSYLYAGENLAIDFSQSSDIEKAWMDSATHKANLLNPRFTEIGIAAQKGMYQGHETVFVVEMFGTPTVPTVYLGQSMAVSVPWYKLFAVEPRKTAAMANVLISIVVLISLLSFAYVEKYYRDNKHMLLAVLLIIGALLIALLEWYGMSSVSIL